MEKDNRLMTASAWARITKRMSKSCALRRVKKIRKNIANFGMKLTTGEMVLNAEEWQQVIDFDIIKKGKRAK